jgi:hypothetical protein
MLKFKQKVSFISFLLLPFLFLVATTYSAFAQEPSKDVTITASGSGKTLEEAKQAALRNAIEQAFGAFISSKTEIFNDQVVADQMSSVSSGNIKSFKVLSEAQFSNSSCISTISAIVSVEKLTSFVQAKGINVEIQGGMFALNIKQKKLNEEGEFIAINNLFGVIHEMLQKSFNYTVTTQEPMSIIGGNEAWKIPVCVRAYSNENFDFVINYFLKTVKSLAMSKSELESYNSLGKVVYEIKLRSNKVDTSFFLRTYAAIDVLYKIQGNWNFYLSNFSLNDGSNELFNQERCKYFTFKYRKSEFENEYLARLRRVVYEYDTVFNQNYSSYYDPDGGCHCQKSIPGFGTIYYPYAIVHNILEDASEYDTTSVIFNLPNSDKLVGSFVWNDYKTLNQIEKVTGFNVNAKGVLSGFMNDGFLVDNNLNKFLVYWDAPNFISREAAEQYLLKLDTSQWKIPNSNELLEMYKYYKKVQLPFFQTILDYNISNESVGDFWYLNKETQIFENVKYPFDEGTGVNCFFIKKL